MNKDEERFILEEDRHRELISAIKSVFQNIPEQNIDLTPLNEVKGSIDKLPGIIDNMLGSLPQQPNNSELMKQIDFLRSDVRAMDKNLSEKLDRLSSVIEVLLQPREIDIDVLRQTGDGRINKVRGRQYYKTIGKA